MAHPWIAERMRHFDSSGIRKVFDLAAKLANPINLSIGQPDYAVPPTVQAAAIDAIRAGKNGYSPTQGIPALVDRLAADLAREYAHPERSVFITSGTSGALVLALLAVVNPGDEVLLFDPYFVMYRSLVGLAGGTPVVIDTYPDFQIDLDKVRASLTHRTKVILFNSPANPTGAVATPEVVKGLAELAAERGILLISDEIYRSFCYDGPYLSPAAFNPDTLVIDGFSKSHAMTGWRLGYAHGPAQVIQEMTKLQQYTFVCAPQPAQWAGLAALDVTLTEQFAAYAAKRDRLVAALKDDFDLVQPGGAFYLFPRAPWGTGSQFVEAAIQEELLIIPGGIFSGRDTHFRLSYAAADSTLERGIEVLLRLARRGRSAVGSRQ